MRPHLPALALLGLVCLATTARAARPVEKRSDATYVVTGAVEAVYVEDGGEYLGYVVAIKLDGVEKGSGLKRGDILYASCYRRKPGAPGIDWDSGHDRVPEAGSRIRAFVNRGIGKNEGVFPDWVDELAPPKPRAAGAARRTP